MRISSPVYEELRINLFHVCSQVVETAAVFTVHARRKTISQGDIAQALARHRLSAYVGEQKRAKKCISRARDKLRRNRTSRSRSSRSKTTGKYARGAKALEDIKFRQKQSECVLIAPTAFARIIAEVTQNLNFLTYARFQHSALNLIQYAIEGLRGKVTGERSGPCNSCQAKWYNCTRHYGCV